MSAFGMLLSIAFGGTLSTPGMMDGLLGLMLRQQTTSAPAPKAA